MWTKLLKAEQYKDLDNKVGYWFRAEPLYMAVSYVASVTVVEDGDYRGMIITLT